MSKMYVGLDIGKKGYIATQGGDKIKHFFSFADHDMKDTFDYIKALKEISNGNLVCVFEA